MTKFVFYHGFSGHGFMVRCVQCSGETGLLSNKNK